MAGNSSNNFLKHIFASYEKSFQMFFTGNKEADAYLYENSASTATHNAL